MVNLLPWQVITASIFVLFGLFFTVSPSFAKAPLNEGQQIIRYDVYAAGVHALQSDLTLDLQGKERYSATLKAKTYGLLGKLAPWEGTFESYGWQAALYKPKLHQSSSTWRSEKEIKKYSYRKDGSFESFTVQDHGKKESVRKVDDTLTQGTSDVLTATLNTMRHITKTGKCDGETDVFDGKRRFKLIFVQTNEVELEASRWNVYSGPAVECTAEVKPIAGCLLYTSPSPRDRG